MGWFSDVHKGNKHWFSEQWKAIKDNPERLFLGAMEPVGAKLWGEITGEDYKPVLDAWGGPSNAVYKSGEDKGIDMDATHNSHRIARVVAAAAMGGGAAGGGGGGGLAGAEAGVGSVGAGIGPAGAGSAGGGIGTMGAGAVGGGGAGASSGGWQEMLKNNMRMPQMGGGGGNQQEMDKQRRQALLLQQMRDHEFQQQMNQKVPGWTT